jgi:hypothetical protein
MLGYSISRLQDFTGAKINVLKLIKALSCPTTTETALPEVESFHLPLVSESFHLPCKVSLVLSV